MKHENKPLRPGDLVEVRSPREISETLDKNGTLDQLPFMKEMVQYCGKQFRVSQKVVIICSSGTKTGSTLRSFRTNDVVLLDDLRCSGDDHDGCQKACSILWREAWLRKVDENSAESTIEAMDAGNLRNRLKTTFAPHTYFCQASELLRATKSLSKLERYSKCITEMRVGNCKPIEMASRIGVFLYWKVRRKLLGAYARGGQRSTPTGTLNLTPGELVQVKPIQCISNTLDTTASNRGLWFSPNMRLLCGQQKRVEKRIERLIVDGTGEMRTLKNTVFLEGSFCGCPHIALGGCSRREYVYWREIWLQRSGESSNESGRQSPSQH